MRRSLLLFCLTPVFIFTLTLSHFVCAQAEDGKANPNVPSESVKAKDKQDANEAAKNHDPMPEDFLKKIIITIYILVIVGFLAIWKGLHSDKTWSMARALSENTFLEQQDAGNPTKKNIVPIDFPSSSRLIALLGLIVLMVTFLGLGSVMIWTLGRTGQVISMGNAQDFLWAGSAMFAPYLFNQGKEAFKAFGKPGA